MSTDQTPLLRSHQPQNYLPEQIVYGISAVGSLSFAGYQWLASSDSEWKTTLATVGVFAASCFGLIRAHQHKTSEASASPSALQETVVISSGSSSTTQASETKLQAELAACQSTIANQQQQISQLSSRIQRLTAQGTPSSVCNDRKPTETLEQLMESDTDSRVGSAPSSPTQPARTIHFGDQPEETPGH